MMVYLQYLVDQLDLERPSWKDDTVLLLDGARYHTGSLVREYLRKLEVQVIWSGPYSYSTAPIEMVFAALKFGEINPDKKPTGKKVSVLLFLFLTNLLQSLDQVAHMVGARLRKTPKETYIRYWHKTTLELFKYLYYQRI